VGIQIKLNEMDVATWVARFYNEPHEFDAVRVTFGAFPDPDGFLSFHMQTGSKNAFGYANPALDQQIALGRQQINQSQRAPIYQDIAQQMLTERQIGFRVRGSAAHSARRAALRGRPRPPGASRCSARASLRAPSRPHPPLDGASPDAHFSSSDPICPPRFRRGGRRVEARRFGISRISVSDVPTAESTSRGVAAGRSAERACERSSDWRGGPQAPPTRN